MVLCIIQNFFKRKFYCKMDNLYFKDGSQFFGHIFWDKVWQQPLFLKATTLLNIFLLNVNFNKFTIVLHFFLIYITQACKISRKSKINSYIINQMFKFQVFCSLKLFIKNKFMDWIINNIWLTQNLTYVFFLRTFDMCVKNINNMQFKIFKIRSHIMFFFSGSCSLKLKPSL